MKQQKHLTLEQRKVILFGISHAYKLKQIGESLQVDPTSISKEVKRNWIEISTGLKNNCKRTNRWPYVCTGCKKIWKLLFCKIINYNPSLAQQKADVNLINSR